jgi:hypothetical protein
VRQNAASTGGELLELEAHFEPAAAPPASHYHPEQDEHFEVLEGALTVEIDGEERTYGAGETFDVPRGITHRMAASVSAPARVIWQVRPALDTEDFFAGLDALVRAGRVDEQGMPEKAAAAALLHRHPHVFRLAGIPEPAQRAMFAAAAAAERLRRRHP